MQKRRRFIENEIQKTIRQGDRLLRKEEASGDGEITKKKGG
jgi:hypothetical protein